MTTAKVTEVSRGSAHRRQVEYVRASLLRGVEYPDKPQRRTTRT
jgi:hypothetical protein